MKRYLILTVLLICLGGCCNKAPEAGTALDAIRLRGTILVGTTGDYRPLSYKDPEDGKYWGFGIDMAEAIASDIGVDITFVPTSWPTLGEDVLTPGLFDLAIGGITITEARRETMDMSEGYLGNGKTILCRREDAGKFGTLADLDRKDVTVMVNPGGLNEKFARENLPHCTLVVHARNEEIPTLVAEGKADVMITEITEAPWYVRHDGRLCAPLLDEPFTRGEIGVLMRKGQDDLLERVNALIRRMKDDGSLRELHDRYELLYVY